MPNHSELKPHLTPEQHDTLGSMVWNHTLASTLPWTVPTATDIDWVSDLMGNDIQPASSSSAPDMSTNDLMAAVWIETMVRCPMRMAAMRLDGYEWLFDASLVKRDDVVLHLSRSLEDTMSKIQ